MWSDVTKLNRVLGINAKYLYHPVAFYARQICSLPVTASNSTKISS
jgi:hypothetical protein